MNFRSTMFLFGLLLGMLWLFGLTVAHKKTAVDASFLVPTLQANPEVVIDKVVIKRRVKDKQPEEFQFVKKDEVWTLERPDIQKAVKVETFRINQLVNQVKDARRSDEGRVSDDLAGYDLVQPPIVMTLQGKGPDKKEREWTFNIGKESADQAHLFVNSSDRPGKAYPILKSAIDSVRFKDPNHLRSRRIFEFSDTAAQTIEIKEGPVQLDLKKGEDTNWRFEKPAYGFADFEGPPAPKDLPPGAKAPEGGGVKGLLAAIATMRVDSEDDFVPLSAAKLDTFGLEEGKEAMLIQVGTVKEKGDKKEVVKETLAIGQSIKDKNQVYARIVGDQGIFKLNSKLLEPIKSVLQNPGPLRSLDVVSIDTKKVDAVIVDKKGVKATLLHPEGKAWEVEAGSGKHQKANDKAVLALLDAVQGKREIVKFYDGDDFKKLDAEMKAPVVVVELFVGGLDEGKQELGKDKKEPKKEEKKDEKPQLKKDAKAAVILSFGTSNKETVNVQRVLADGTTSRFTLPGAILDRVAPGDISLAFLDPSLPNLAMDEIEGVVIARDKEKIDIEKGWGEKAKSWFFKQGKEPPGKNPTDPAMTSQLVGSLAGLSVQKWLHKIDPKEDLDKYGLKKPALEVTLLVRADKPIGAASLLGLLATTSEWRGFLGETALLANRYAAPVEKIVLKVGKETEEEKDKPAVYAQRSDKDMLFLVPADFVRGLREVDLHDRTSVVLAQPLLDAALLGLQAADAHNLVLAGSPLFTNQVQNFDPAKVKELRLAVRTREELRTLTFQRTKDKEWRDLSGLQEFNLDSQKVNQLVTELATLKAGRWVTVAGGVRAEQKLTASEATLRIKMVQEDGTIVTLTVGAPFERIGYYAHTSSMPEAVFMLAPAQVEPLLQGPGYFGKERVAAGR